MALDPITLAWEAAKKLREISNKLRDAEAQNAIADLMMSLADVKTELVEARDEIQKLKKKTDLRAIMHLRDDGFYYFNEKPDDSPQGPFCSKCLTTNGELGLIKPGPMHSKVCCNCNTIVHA